MSEYYKFFQNKKCEYFPCHKGIPEEDFNCLFCYCPLYTLGKSCGGNCEYLKNGIKSCINCGFPHHRKNYDKVTGRTKYYEDRMPAGTLYIRVKHAEIAHGFVKSIDTAAAEAIDVDENGVISGLF